MSDPKITLVAKAPSLLKLFVRCKSIVIAGELEKNSATSKVDPDYPMQEIINTIILRWEKSHNINDNNEEKKLKFIFS